MYAYLITGVIAGITSSILYIAGMQGNSLSLFLYFVAPLPLFISGLGWGAVSAALGAGTGLVICAFAAGLPGGLIFLASIGAIPTILSYYALLSRTKDVADPPLQPEGSSSLTLSPNVPSVRDWYPLGRLIIMIAGYATLLTSLFILFIMPSTPELKVSLEKLFTVILAQNPDLKVRLGGEDAVPQMVQLFLALLPATMAAYTFVATLANLWLASKIIAASNTMIRPPFRMAEIWYPRMLPLVLFGILALSFLPGLTHTVALAGTAALTLAFMLLGLVVIHAIVPKVPARAVFLSMFYVTVFILLKFAYVALALIGIAETIFDIRRRFSQQIPPNNSGTPPTIPGG